MGLLILNASTEASYVRGRDDVRSNVEQMFGHYRQGVENCYPNLVLLFIILFQGGQWKLPTDAHPTLCPFLLLPYSRVREILEMKFKVHIE